jgi:CRISPR-associated protein Cas5d
MPSDSRPRSSPTWKTKLSREHRNSIKFRVWGRQALFTDPVSRIGGEKCSYHIPTYEALRGITKSIYWKPSIDWVIDECQVINRIQTQPKGMKPLNLDGGNALSIYTYLIDVEYRVRAHFVWNSSRPDLSTDHDEHKHHNIAKRSLDRGGRQDIFLGTRECQGYVEPCEILAGTGAYADVEELAFGLMFHGFDYPDCPDANGGKLYARHWRPVMRKGVIRFDPPDQCRLRREVREMNHKDFVVGQNMMSVGDEATQMSLVP